MARAAVILLLGLLGVFCWSGEVAAVTTVDANHVWSRQLGTTADDFSAHVAVAADRSVNIAGYSGGAFDATSTGQYDLIVARYSGAGTHKWSFQAGTYKADNGYGITTDSSSNVIVVGSTADVMGSEQIGGVDVIILKISGSGSEKFRIQTGSGGADVATATACDSSDNIFVTGWTQGAVTGSNSGGRDVFVYKYTADGTQSWVVQQGSTGEDIATAVATTSDGSVLVAGHTSGQISTSTANAGGYDAFLLKYNSAGTVQFRVQVGTTSSDKVRALATDSAGAAYLAGTTTGAMTGSNAGLADVFVVKYTSSGTVEWTAQKGTSSFDDARGIALDSAGNVLVAGWTAGTFTTASNSDNYDAFVLTFTSTGTYSTAFQTDVNQVKLDVPLSFAIDSSDEAVLVGSSNGKVDGNSNSGGWDLFVISWQTYTDPASTNTTLILLIVCLGGACLVWFGWPVVIGQILGWYVIIKEYYGKKKTVNRVKKADAFASNIISRSQPNMSSMIAAANRNAPPPVVAAPALAYEISIDDLRKICEVDDEAYRLFLTDRITLDNFSWLFTNEKAMVKLGIKNPESHQTLRAMVNSLEKKLAAGAAPPNYSPPQVPGAAASPVPSAPPAPVGAGVDTGSSSQGSPSTSARPVRAVTATDVPASPTQVVIDGISAVDDKAMMLVMTGKISKDNVKDLADEKTLKKLGITKAESRAVIMGTVKDLDKKKKEAEAAAAAAAAKEEAAQKAEVEAHAAASRSPVLTPKTSPIKAGKGKGADKKVVTLSPLKGPDAPKVVTESPPQRPAYTVSDSDEDASD